MECPRALSQLLGAQTLRLFHQTRLRRFGGRDVIQDRVNGTIFTSVFSRGI